MSLNGKKIFKAAMMLRQPHNHLKKKLYPGYAQKLVRTTQKPQPLTYKMHPAIQNLQLRYPHPQPLQTLQEIPFNIQRTNSGNIPVYIEYNSNHKVKRTIVRKVSGDIQKLAQQIRKIVSNNQVRVKVGYLQIPGVHKQSILTWLIRLGF